MDTAGESKLHSRVRSTFEHLKVLVSGHITSAKFKVPLTSFVEFDLWMRYCSCASCKSPELPHI